MTRRSNIIAHYERNWGVALQPCPFSAGPIEQLGPDFAILKCPPHADRQMWTYVTCGMSQSGDAKSIELHMFSPWEADELVELLVAVAHFHRTGAALDVSHTVNFGQPWIGASKCEYGLVSLPYLDGPSLELMTARGETVNFYWLLPITKAERDFKKANGAEALEELFDEVEIEYVNPQRASAV